MANVLITGDRGFIAGYLIKQLLEDGHRVIGIDNDWKYGPQEKDFDDNPNYHHVKGDAKRADLLLDLMVLNDIEYIVAGAAKIGGISFFHELAYDLMSENEVLMASIFDATIQYSRMSRNNFKRIMVMSSSMVYESTDVFPTPEHAATESPPPLSTYGFQKLAAEFFAKGAREQYGLQYSIARPFNCVGIGEKRALLDKEVSSGNIKLAFSHVVPDLIQKIYKGQRPLRILGDGHQIRHYTSGPDLARGLKLCLFKDEALWNAFNLSTPEPTSVLDLAERIWKKMTDEKFEYESDPPFEYDVKYRSPSTTKAKELLGFETEITLDEILDETIPWVCKMVDEGKI